MRTKRLLLAGLLALFGCLHIQAQRVNGDVKAVAIDKTGRYFVTGGDNGKVNIWDLETHLISKEICYDSYSRINNISISADNQLMAVAVAAGNTCIYSFPGGKLIKQLKEAGSVNAIFLPDGKLATVNYESQVQIWDINSQSMMRELNPKKTIYTPLAVSPDGRYLLTAAPKDQFKLWDLQSTENTEVFKDKPGSTPKSFAFSSDSKLFAVAGDAGEHGVTVYDLATKAVVKIIPGQANDNAVVFAPDNKSIIMAGYTTVSRVSLETGEKKDLKFNHKEQINCLAINPSTSLMISGSSDDSAILYDVSKSSVLKQVPHYDPNTKAVEHTLGQKFGGGMVFHSYRTSDGQEHGLIVALPISKDAVWSDNTGELVGADSWMDGSFNTNAIVKSGASGAAALCRDYNAGGFTDWYLPSIKELELLNANVGLSSWKGFHWTSTEAKKETAFRYEFDKLKSSPGSKRDKGIVLAMRAF